MAKNTNDIALTAKWVVYSSPKEVFEALTKKNLIAEWCGQAGEVELKPGGHVEMFDGWVKGEVVDFKPGQKLSYTWKPSDWPTKADTSVVTYEFTKHAAGCEVVLNHSGFPSQEEKEKHLDGWTDFVFEPLNDWFVSKL